MSDQTRIVLHELSLRSSGDSWIIGRMDTGDFVAVPPVARRAIALLADGHTVGEAARVLRQETGSDVALADFVTSLHSLGFLASIDGEPCGELPPARPTMPWLQAHHVRWLLHPSVPWLTLAVVAAATAMVISDPSVLPPHNALAWSRHAGVVVAGNAVIAWILVWLHELGHLSTARAAGVPSRMSLGTRLQFLVAQTDVSGVWGAPRRTRLTVYLAGMAVNLVAACVCVLVIGLADPAGLPRHLLAAATLESLLMLPLQLLIFMRTDVYFLIQDLAGCANLYADGSARVRYLARRLVHGIRRKGSLPVGDPSDSLPPGERRAVRVYSWLLVSGTAAALAAAAFITAPATVILIARALNELSRGSSAGKADGSAAFVVTAAVQVAWLRTWWRRHGSRVTSCFRTWASRPAGRR